LLRTLANRANTKNASSGHPDSTAENPSQRAIRRRGKNLLRSIPVPMSKIGGFLPMISPVSSAHPAGSASGTQNTQGAKPKPQPPPKQKEDSVQLSSVAKTYGDVDHDGDSK
jgi:hypothetical protein